MNASHTSFSRRDFMKKSALTAGAIVIFSQGIALAGNDGYPGSSGTPTKEVDKTLTYTVTLETTRAANETITTPAVLNRFYDMWPENRPGSDASGDGVSVTEPIITKQIIHEDAELESSNSVAGPRETIVIAGDKFRQTFTTVTTYVYK